MRLIATVATLVVPAMIVAVVTIAPALVKPMALAIPASLVRIGLTLHTVPAILARSADRRVI